MIGRAKTIAIGLTEELRRPTAETFHRIYAFGTALGLNAGRNGILEGELRAVSEALTDEAKEHMEDIVRASSDPDPRLLAELVLEFDGKLKGGRERCRDYPNI